MTDMENENLNKQQLKIKGILAVVIISVMLVIAFLIKDIESPTVNDLINGIEKKLNEQKTTGEKTTLSASPEQKNIQTTQPLVPIDKKPSSKDKESQMGGGGGGGGGGIIEEPIQEAIYQEPEASSEVLFSLSEDASLDEVSQKIIQSGGVVKAKYTVGNIIFAEVPNSKIESIVSTSLVDAWSNKKISALLDQSVPQIGANIVWLLGYTGKNVKIAILDTGIDSTHTMLQGKVIAEKIFTGESHANDVYGHGTHVAGIAAGTNSSGGLYNGVAPDSLLMNAKVLDDSGSGWMDWIIAGINWAVDPDNNPETNDGADVISMSLGGYPCSDPWNSPESRAIKAAAERGVLVVVAAGNNGPGTIATPGCSPYAFTVGAVDGSNIVASFSSRQDVPTVGIKPDIMAPGVSIDSSFPRNQYRSWQGTSMATPHVSGAVALLLEANSKLTPYQLRTLMEINAEDKNELGKDIDYGYGILNLTNIINPRMIISQNSFNLETALNKPLKRSLNISNYGAKDLIVYNITHDNWIKVNLTNNTIEALKIENLTFEINPNDIGVGVYSGEINLTTNDKNITIPVALTVYTTDEPVFWELKVPDFVYRGDEINLTVNVTDEKSIESVNAKLFNPNNNLTTTIILEPNAGFWTKPYILPYDAPLGKYTVNFSASDADGHTTIVISTFEVVDLVLRLPLEFEMNKNYNISILFKNTETLSKETTALLTIKDLLDTETLSDSITADVPSSKIHEFNFKWNTTYPKDYSIVVEIVDNGTLKGFSESNVTVFVPKDIIIENFSYSCVLCTSESGAIRKGSVINYTVVAENIGSIYINASASIYVVSNGKILDVIKSEEREVVPSGNVEFRLDKPFTLAAGNYTFIFNLMYGNRIVSASENVSFYTPQIGRIKEINLSRLLVEDESSIEVSFENFGDVPIETSMEGNLLSNGEILDSFLIGTSIVNSSSITVFQKNYSFSNAINYTLNILANYEGNNETSEINFTVYDNETPEILDLEFDGNIKQYSPLVITADINDSSNLKNASIVVEGKAIPMLMQSKVGKNYTFTGTFYGTYDSKSYNFYLTACDEFENCVATNSYSFNVDRCSKQKIDIVSENYNFDQSLNESYCISHWQKSKSSTPPLDYLNKSDAVVWSEGDNFANINDADADVLIEYVRQNGRLLLEGSEIASKHVNDELMRNVTHSKLLEDIVFAQSVADVNSTQSNLINITKKHPITLSIPKSFGYNETKSMYPDSLTTIDSIELAGWDKGSAIVIYGENVGDGPKPKIAFLPFSLDALEGNVQGNLTNNIVRWILMDSEIDLSIKNVTFPSHMIASKPATINLSLELPVSAFVKTYVDGEEVNNTFIINNQTGITLSFSEGMHKVEFEINPDYLVNENNYVNNFFSTIIKVVPVQPDVLLEDIKTSLLYPRSNDNILITAFVKNSGGTELTNVKTSIMINNSLIKEEFLNLLPGEIGSVNTTWNAISGITDFVAKTDTENSIMEINETDNQLSKPIYICNKPMANLLLVIDDNAKSFASENPDSSKTWSDALQKNGYCFEIWKKSEGEFSGNLSDYKAIIWSTGDFWNGVLDQNDTEFLSGFNGNLIFEGADIGFDSNESFLHSNLHSTFEKDIIANNETKLIVNNSYNILGVDNLEFNSSLSPYPDSILPYDGVSLAYWENGSSAIVYYKNEKSKIFYLAFSIDAVKESERLIHNMLKVVANSPPVFQSINNITVYENEIIEIIPNATDADENNLTFYFTPPFNESGIWQTTYEDSGDYRASITVNDGEYNVTGDFNITVLNVNRKPEITSHYPLDNPVINEGETQEFNISVIDPDGNRLYYRACIKGYHDGSCTPLEFLDGAKIVQKYTMSNTSAGSYDVTINVSDNKSTTSKNWTLTVLRVNLPPELKEIGNRIVDENSTLSFVVNASDPDGDGLVYSAHNLPSGASFENQTFTWTPSFKQSGTYEVTFNISDRELFATENVRIVVNNINHAPKLNFLNNITVNEGGDIEIIADANDANGDDLTYYINDTRLIQDNNTFTWHTNYNDAGMYPIKIVLSDGELDDSQEILITINNVNRVPVLNSIENQVIRENETLIIRLDATDPDGDVLTFSTNATNGDLSDSGVYTWQTTYEDAGDYYFAFTTSDGHLNNNKITKITVLNVNRQPKLSLIENKAINEGELLEFSIIATDPDGGALTYSAHNLPLGSTFTDQLFSWTPNFTQSSTYTVMFEVSDGNFTDSQNVAINVVQVNQPPRLIPINNRSVNENETIEFSVQATDIDDDVLTFSIDSLPEHASFDTRTGRFSWTPTFEQSGNYLITFGVSDGSLSDTETMSIHVENVIRPTSVEITGGSDAVLDRSTGGRHETTVRLQTKLKDLATNRYLSQVSKIEFYVAGTKIGEDSDSNDDSIYEIVWDPDPTWSTLGVQSWEARFVGADDYRVDSKTSTLTVHGVLNVNVAWTPSGDCIDNYGPSNVCGGPIVSSVITITNDAGNTLPETQYSIIRTAGSDWDASDNDAGNTITSSFNIVADNYEGELDPHYKNYTVHGKLETINVDWMPSGDFIDRFDSGEHGGSLVNYAIVSVTDNRGRIVPSDRYDISTSGDFNPSDNFAGDSITSTIAITPRAESYWHETISTSKNYIVHGKLYITLNNPKGESYRPGENIAILTTVTSDLSTEGNITGSSVAVRLTNPDGKTYTLDTEGSGGTYKTLFQNTSTGLGWWKIEASAEKPNYHLASISSETAFNLKSTQLSNGYVSPKEGDSSTVFNYYVVYTDSDNKPPVTALVYIDGQTREMGYINGSYNTGALFKYATKLSSGKTAYSENHTFHFEFNDGGYTTRLPEGVEFKGPNTYYWYIKP